MKRKQHSQDLGYIAERMNPYMSGRKVVIYEAAEQGIDVGNDRYAIVCDAHATLMGASSMKDARLLMHYPDEFCEKCRELAGEA